MCIREGVPWISVFGCSVLRVRDGIALAGCWDISRVGKGCKAILCTPFYHAMWRRALARRPHIRKNAVLASTKPEVLGTMGTR